MFDNSRSRLTEAAAVLQQVQQRLGVRAAEPGSLQPGVYYVESNLDWLAGVQTNFQRQTPWIAAIGVENLGWEAVAEAGIELQKIVVVRPRPEHLPTIAPLIVEGFQVVILGANLDYKTQRTTLLRSRNSGAVVFTTCHWSVGGIGHFNAHENLVTANFRQKQVT